MKIKIILRENVERYYQKMHQEILNFIEENWDAKRIQEKFYKKDFLEENIFNRILDFEMYYQLFFEDAENIIVAYKELEKFVKQPLMANPKSILAYVLSYHIFNGRNSLYIPKEFYSDYSYIKSLEDKMSNLGSKIYSKMNNIDQPEDQETLAPVNKVANDNFNFIYKSIGSLDYSKQSQGKIFKETFFNDPKIFASKIDVLSKYKITKYIGSGQNGSAFLLDNGLIFKLGLMEESGMSDFNVNKFKKIQDRQFSGEASINDIVVYDVKKISNRCYYVITNKVNPVNQSFKKDTKEYEIFSKLGKFIVSRCKIIREHQPGLREERIQKLLTYMLKKTIPPSYWTKPNISRWIQPLIKWAISLTREDGSDFIDFQPENIGTLISEKYKELQDDKNPRNEPILQTFDF